jgi:hypothetical protein
LRGDGLSFATVEDGARRHRAAVERDAGSARRLCCSVRSRSRARRAAAASAPHWYAACARPRRLGHRAILLVGDAPYYGRFGFTADATRALRLPGPYEPERLLGLALKPGALDGARGLVRATGHRLPKGLPDFLTGANHASLAA